MVNPRVSDLPAPPPGKTGWPWTEGCDPLPPAMPDGSPWPRITVVTPSFDQGRYIEQTIRSVLLQGYPDLEYLVIDGGSRDGTVEVIGKYAPWLAHWVSEQDEGQSHAINKGMRRATGAVAAYVNSDDYYLPGALRAAAEALGRERDAAMVYGDCDGVDEGGARTGGLPAADFDLEAMLRWFHGIPQAAVFFRAAAARELGWFDQSLHYVMDYDLWLRLGMRYRLARLPLALAAMRTHEGSKTTSQRAAFNERFRRERFAVKLKALRDPALPRRLRSRRSSMLRMFAWKLMVECLKNGDVREAAHFMIQIIRTTRVADDE
ncbi:MAG: glycosyltransferase [Candidatus Edwardsbacteria bacterium]|jgi:glycosyltransferase involved in cell wall biosynthesis|nr:glycosyltransferase [Candidatus Edwardsbacteria bacterium]